MDEDTDMLRFEKARAKGEPTFTLRSQDFSAPAVVDYWANLNMGAMGPTHPKIIQAREIAEKMRRWPGRRQAD